MEIEQLWELTNGFMIFFVLKDLIFPSMKQLQNWISSLHEAIDRPRPNRCLYTLPVNQMQHRNFK